MKKERVLYSTLSPSARKVWIEILDSTLNTRLPWSPSARKVWIEIKFGNYFEANGSGHLPQGRCGLKYMVI